MTHYDTLGIHKDATPDEIRRAWRSAASKAHPDREGGDPQRMAAVNQAFEVLGDPARRASYDNGGDGKPEFSAAAAAEALLTRLIAEALDPEEEGAVLPAVRTRLAQLQTSATRTKFRAEQTIKRLTKRRGTVRVADGQINIVDRVIDQQLQISRGECQGAADMLATVEKVRELLEGYSENAPSVTATHYQFGRAFAAWPAVPGVSG